MVGDFNVDFLKAQDHRLANSFVDTTSSYYFLPIITQPARITQNTATLIDNLFTNRVSKVIESTILTEDIIIYISDHLPILAVTGLGAPLSSSVLKRRYVSPQNE